MKTNRRWKFLSALAATALNTSWLLGCSVILFVPSDVSAQESSPGLAPLLPPPVAAPNTQAPLAPIIQAPPNLMPLNATVAPSLAGAAGNAPLPPANPLRDQALTLTAQAKLELQKGNIPEAKSLIERANSLRVPDTAYASNQLRPWQVAMEIDRVERLRTSSPPPAMVPPTMANAPAVPQGPNAFSPPTPVAGQGVVTAGAMMPVANPANSLNSQANNAPIANPISTGIFRPNTDTTHNQPAAAQEPSGLKSSSSSQGDQLFQDGIKALTAGNRDKAMELFTEAWKYERDLDPIVRAQLKDKLTLLQSNRAAPKAAAGEPVTAVQELNQEQNLARQKMWREVTTEIAEAERLVDSDPNAALDRLQFLRTRISQSNVDGAIRKGHLAMVDRVIGNIQAYIDLNRPAIEQEERNRVTEDRMALEAATEAKIDAEVQSMVDQYNELFQKGMYAEAEILAKKVGELNPNSEIAAVMLSKAILERRHQEQADIQAMKSEMGAIMLQNVDLASTPIDDNKPYLLPDAKFWSDITRSRRQFDENYQMTPSEKAIRERLNEPVDVSFNGRSLTDAMQTLSDMTQIPIVIDQLGLSAEGIASDQRVNLNLNGQSISLRSALTLMLESLSPNLTYVIKNEVLKITSRDTSNRERIRKTYPVRDLVIPIPNFVTDYNSGLAGALQSAYQASSTMLLVQTQDASTAQLANQQLAMNNLGAMDANSAALGQLGGMGGAMPGMGGMPGMMGGGQWPRDGK